MVTLSMLNSSISSVEEASDLEQRGRHAVDVIVRWLRSDTPERAEAVREIGIVLVHRRQQANCQVFVVLLQALFGDDKPQVYASCCAQAYTILS